MRKGVETARQLAAPMMPGLSDWAHVTGATPAREARRGQTFFSIAAAVAPNARALDSELLSCDVVCSFRGDGVHLEDINDAGMAAPVLPQIYASKRRPGRGNLGRTLASRPTDNVMPGTATGSAPQESWHGNAWKPAFEQMAGKQQDSLAFSAPRVLQFLRAVSCFSCTKP